ncbi:MAG: prepilin-type N-terminal cleavage/methylation domain-containing protein, partial [Candidatus Omnitrophica bacterium]|nr:prepilin-type N-terminal cleavage/methylation domain-containing protein [Candidatus Omnitrophota bacterium]
MSLKRGFTLIELVIVITIVSILAISVLASGRAKGPIRLEAACQKLALDLRYTQEMAMAEQVRFGISFDPGSESYFGYRVTTSVKAKDPQ